HLRRVRRRDHPSLPRHRHLRCRRAPRGRGERTDRRRVAPRHRPRRDPLRDDGRQDIDRALPTQGPPPHRLTAPPRARAVAHEGIFTRTSKVGAMAVLDVGTHAPASAEPFEHLVLDFLAYLEFERGLSRNTLEAYRSDLLQYGAYLHGRSALAVTHSD